MRGGEKHSQKRQITSIPGSFGNTKHYDEDGSLIGEGIPKVFGGYYFFDANANWTGCSQENLSGSYTCYQEDGSYAGRSILAVSGGAIHFDKDSRLIG